jgi:YidC/Oxa1 family membrane protein insertase
MDRNTIIGLVLIAIILFGSTFFFKKAETDEAARKQTTSIDSAVQTKKDTSHADGIATDTTKTGSLDSVNSNIPAGWAAFGKGQNQDIMLQNDDIIIRVSTKGGRITYAELKKYKTFDGKPLVMITPESSQYEYELKTGAESIRTENLYFRPEKISALGVTMSVSLPGGESIKQVYKLDNEGYLVHYDLNLVNMNQAIPKKESYFDLRWEADALKHEKDSTIAARNATIHYRDQGEDPDYLQETKDDHEAFKGKTDWVSFKQQFFCQALIAPQQPFINTDLTSVGAKKPRTLKHYSADLTLPFDHTPSQVYKMHFYLGPLHYKTLRNVNDKIGVNESLQLERQIPLGWSFGLISAVNRYIIIPMFNLLSNVIGNYGIIILILAIFIKILVLPFTYKTYLSSAKMRLLKPELDELKQKYGEDMARQQQEQMKLYRKAGVSPFGGCLPLLLQFPILVAMFRFFPSSIELRQESFLWAKDLSTYDSIYQLPFNIPFYGDHVSLFTLLMTISTLIYTRMNNSLSPQQPEFKWLSYLMPIMFLGFFNQYSAGLSLYYFYFNILTFAQQYLFKMFISEDKLKQKIEENKKKPVKKGGLQARLEEMSKRQQELARQRQTNGSPKKPTRRK